jgi:predicted ATPase
MIPPVRAAYNQLIAAHELKPDQAQERAVSALDRLAAGIGVVAVDLEGFEPLALFGLPLATTGDLAVSRKREFGQRV